MYPKQLEIELGWKKQNISKTAKKLERFGMLVINDYPVFYRTNEKWICPDIQGQLRLKISLPKN